MVPKPLKRKAADGPDASAKKARVGGVVPGTRGGMLMLQMRMGIRPDRTCEIPDSVCNVWRTMPRDEKEALCAQYKARFPESMHGSIDRSLVYKYANVDARIAQYRGTADPLAVVEREVYAAYIIRIEAYLKNPDSLPESHTLTTQPEIRARNVELNRLACAYYLLTPAELRVKVFDAMTHIPRPVVDVAALHAHVAAAQRKRHVVQACTQLLNAVRAGYDDEMKPEEILHRLLAAPIPEAAYHAEICRELAPLRFA